MPEERSLNRRDILTTAGAITAAAMMSGAASGEEQKEQGGANAPPDEGSRFSPIPINIQLKGKINNIDVTIQGNGVVRSMGVYDAILNFSTVPGGFHPIAISAFTMSMCCEAGASMRNGALNILAMGATGYTTRRTLTFNDAGEITIEGEASVSRKGIEVKGTVSGNTRLPKDIAGHSVFVMKSDPAQEGRGLSGKGEGSLFKENGEEVAVRIESSHSFRPERLSRPLRKRQYRIVTEDGELHGMSYRTRIHSIYDGRSPFEKVDDM